MSRGGWNVIMCVYAFLLHILGVIGTIQDPSSALKLGSFIGKGVNRNAASSTVSNTTTHITSTVTPTLTRTLSGAPGAGTTLPSTFSNGTHQQNATGCPQYFNTTGFQQATLPPGGTGLSYAMACNSAIKAWTSASAAWLGAVAVTSGSMETFTETQVYSQGTASPTTKLCDGYPRVQGTFTGTGNSTSVFTSTYPETYTGLALRPACLAAASGHTEYPVPSPSCKIQGTDCASLSSLYFKTATVYDQGASGPICSLDDEGFSTFKKIEPSPSCYINGDNVRLFYWPQSTKSAAVCDGPPMTITPKLNGTRVANVGTHRITSPSVFLSIDRVYAQYAIAATEAPDLPPEAFNVSTYSNVQITLAPQSLSSVVHYLQGVQPYQEELSILFTKPLDDLVQTYTMSSSAEPFNIANLQGPVPASAYFLGKDFESLYSIATQTYLQTIYDDYRAFIAVPEQIRNLNPAYGDCQLDLRGIYDPPTTMQPAATIGGITAHQLHVKPTTAPSPVNKPAPKPTPTRPVGDPSPTREDQLVTTSATVNEPAPAVDPVQTSTEVPEAPNVNVPAPAVQGPQTSANSAPTHSESPDPALPSSQHSQVGSPTSNSDPGQADPGLPGGAPDPNKPDGSINPGSSDPASDPSPSGSPSEPSLSGNPSDPGSGDPNAITSTKTPDLPDDPTNPTAPHSPTSPAPQGNSNAAPSPTDPSDPDTPSSPGPAVAQPITLSPPNGSPIVASAVDPSNPKAGISIGGTTLLPGHPAITKNGQILNAAPGGAGIVLGGSSTVLFPSAPGPAVAQPITLSSPPKGSPIVASAVDPSNPKAGISIGGTTLLPGHPAITQNGQILSAAPDGAGIVLGGSSTMLFPSAPANPSKPNANGAANEVAITLGPPNQVMTATPTLLPNGEKGFLIDGQMMVANGPPATIGTHVVSMDAESALVVDGTSTIPLTTTPESDATMTLAPGDVVTASPTVSTLTDGSSVTEEVLAGQTLTAGGAAGLVGQATVSLDKGGQLVANGTKTMGAVGTGILYSNDAEGQVAVRGWEVWWVVFMPMVWELWSCSE
ncbi:MAG: hypothetical protein M1828_001594 [Chrysothrix sp. TS-e1954]|nr:MAG: hypothetical protein M1828_001594 [Chrysothrix sp. TS-e1954]